MVLKQNLVIYVPYIIFCVFFQGRGRKLKQNLKGGARCKSLGTSGLEVNTRKSKSLSMTRSHIQNQTITSLYVCMYVCTYHIKMLRNSSNLTCSYEVHD
jgi:hypothetical protein